MIMKNCLIILGKSLKNILHLLTGLQFVICHVIKTRVGFEIQKWQDFKTILATILLLFKIVINLKILENSQVYVHSEHIYL